jgi:hypothetical protein
MGTQDTRSRVWVGKPKPIKDLNLTQRHFTSFPRPFVVKTEQMQYAVYGHMRPMRLRRFSLDSRLPSHHGSADHEFAEKVPAVRADARPGEREHIGWLVLAAVVHVQGAAARRAYDTHRQNHGQRMIR